ncbi:uncharacterized protein LOC117267300 isoform X3 [Epinephelus lanceolatus]
MVKRSLDSIESSDFGVPFWINRYRSHVMPDDLIGPDIDPVGDHDDLRTTRSMNSFDSGVSLKSDQSKAGIILFEDSSPLRDRLRKFLFSGIISCLSVRRKDSQGCTADVKDTPPSPKEMMSMVSMNSFDSGVSLKSDQSKAGMILFQRRNLSQGGDEPGAVV